jgi:hypothetical protein
MTHSFIGPVATGLVLLASPGAAQMALPTDVQQSCTVAREDFAAWFEGGSPTPDGVVSAASSVTFPTDNTVCDFYKWGAQMFLWLTSPETDGRVLDGPALFNVLPADASGKRYLQENDTGAALSFALRTEKFDEIGEVGQAGSGGTLRSQAGGLVYYGVHVNDVYGYFLTGQKGGDLSQTVFPRDAQDLGEIERYLSNAFPGTMLEAPETLVMEFKTSWVEASTVPDQSQFVTIEATVPTFTPNADNTVWTPSGLTSTMLALVGIHIVGTVQDHPEFVWITYEHIMNAPDGDYYYMNSAGQVVEQAFSSDGTFLFMETGSAEPQNIECAKESKGNIVANTTSSGAAVCDGGIVASNTYRQYPWGSAKSDQGHAAVTNNTELLSLNASIRSQLSAGDVRSNYIQTGGIWTSAPSATEDAPIPKTQGYVDGDLRGSLFAFNATMETYTQGTNCFSCHHQSATAPNSFQPFELSHIYSQIVPLTPSGY